MLVGWVCMGRSGGGWSGLRAVRLIWFDYLWSDCGFVCVLLFLCWLIHSQTIIPNIYCFMPINNYIYFSLKIHKWFPRRRAFILATYIRQDIMALALWDNRFLNAEWGLFESLIYGIRPSLDWMQIPFGITYRLSFGLENDGVWNINTKSLESSAENGRVCPPFRRYCKEIVYMDMNLFPLE